MIRSALLVLAAAGALAACGGDKPGASSGASPAASPGASQRPGADSARHDTSATSTPSPSNSTAAPAAGEHRYDHKSGIVTLKSVSGPTTDAVISFDDYGAKLSTTTNYHEKVNNTPLVISNVSLFAGGVSILYDTLKKIGYRSAEPEATMNYFPRFENMTPEARKALLITEIEGRTILGKACRGFAVDRNGAMLKVWTWGGIPLRTESHFGSDTMLMLEAVKVEVDVPVPPGRFEVPPDVTLSERPVGMK